MSTLSPLGPTHRYRQHGGARKQSVLVQALVLRRVKARSRVKQGVLAWDLNARFDKRSRCLH